MTQPAQRWLFGRDSYRPPHETIRTAEYDVDEFRDDDAAKAFVCTHHYSRTFPVARARFGLYRRGQLVGVAVFSHPVNDAVFDPLPGAPTDSMELGRFVLLDEVPGNGESWFLARTYELLRGRGLSGVLAHSDPTRRRNHAGELVLGGHVGTIYQATNACYLGQGTPRTLRLLPDGQVYSARAMQKVRAREQGWRYAARQLEHHGAEPLGADEDGAAWLARWLPRLTTKVRHPGNHRYAWTLQRRDRGHLPPSLPYPKRLATLGALEARP